MREVEASGTTIDEAIAAGLAKLGLPRNEVNIEIIEEGRKGLLGIGGRDAVVRIKALAAAEEPAKVVESTPPPEKAAPAPPVKKQAPPEAVAAPPPAPKQEGPEVADPTAEDQQVAEEMIRELLDLMQIDAQVSSHLSEPDDLTGRKMTVVDINGDDLGLLIGPRGETLNALQYVSRLMVGHKTRKRAQFVIDIEGYRERREQALTRLAERMGSKAVKRGKPVTLEPMPAHERRVIHMALREDVAVYTESTGEGSRRRVRIYPK